MMNLISRLATKGGIILLLVIALIGAGIYGSILIGKIDRAQIELNNTKANEIAYATGLKKWEDRYGQEHAKTIMFNENLTRFKDSQDSITQQLVAIINDQGISLKKLRQASLIDTKVTTQLTREIQTKLPDTVVDLSNKDIKNIITLSPYRITSDIELYNRQSIFATDSTYKEFVPYRKKFFLARWLQEKHKRTLVNIEVINSNPLIKTEQQKFIHIVK